MKIGLALINLGNDISNTATFNSLANTSFEQLVSKNYFSHMGFAEIEIETLVKFIENVVVGGTVGSNETAVDKVIDAILKQTVNGEELKYPVIAGINVVDYPMRKLDTSETFFSMPSGEQAYSTIIFMAKQNVILDYVYLVFQSSRDMQLTVTVKLFSASAGDYIINHTYDTLNIRAGKYDDLSGDDYKPEVEIDFQQLNKTGTSDVKVRKFDNENPATGGLLDFDFEYKVLGLEEKEIASEFTVDKETVDADDIITYNRTDCDYFEICFETTRGNEKNIPFEIGYLMFMFEAE